MAMKDISDRQIVEACVEYIADGTPSRHVITILMEKTGQPEKVCYMAAERASSRGLINYGISIRRAWAEEKGLELLK